MKVFAVELTVRTSYHFMFVLSLAAFPIAKNKVKHNSTLENTSHKTVESIGNRQNPWFFPERKPQKNPSQLAHSPRSPRSPRSPWWFPNPQPLSHSRPLVTARPAKRSVVPPGAWSSAAVISVTCRENSAETSVNCLEIINLDRCYLVI